MNTTAAQCLDNRIPQRAAAIATLAALIWYNAQSEDVSIDNPQGLTNLQRKMNDYNRGLLGTIISYALIAAIFLHVYETEITLTKERLNALHTFLLGDDNGSAIACTHD